MIPKRKSSSWAAMFLPVSAASRPARKLLFRKGELEFTPQIIGIVASN